MSHFIIMLYSNSKWNVLKQQNNEIRCQIFLKKAIFISVYKKSVKGCCNYNIPQSNLLVVKLLQLWQRANSRLPHTFLRVRQDVWMNLEAENKRGFTVSQRGNTGSIYKKSRLLCFVRAITQTQCLWRHRLCYTSIYTLTLQLFPMTHWIKDYSVPSAPAQDAETQPGNALASAGCCQQQSGCSWSATHWTHRREGCEPESEEETKKKREKGGEWFRIPISLSRWCWLKVQESLLIMIMSLPGCRWLWFCLCLACQQSVCSL